MTQNTVKFTGLGVVALSPDAMEKRRDAGSDRVDSWQSRIETAVSRVTVWHVAFFALFFLAVLTRFWDLGARALHHDESLHTYYSWVFSEGGGYTHHPMMHGPFLFHINALAYVLLGDSDTTSRVTVALFGVILVMLPWFLRGQAFLGRWGALTASFLLLVSPSMLYFSRFIRHDIFALVGAFLIFIAFVRYMERPESRWIVLAIVSTGFVLTTHEITFVNLFIMGTFAGALILYRVLPLSLVMVTGAAITFLIGRAILHRLGVPSIPEIPWQEPTTSQLVSYLGSLLTHPIIVLAIGLGLFILVSSIWLLVRRRDPDLGWIASTFGREPEETTAGRFATALRDGRAWLVGSVAGFVLFAVLYTSLFSNLGGLGSGTFGALGYWLGQHDVQRGQQPWFYYLVLAPQYEYLAIAGSLSALAMIARRAWLGRRHNLELDRRFYFLALTAYWLAVMFLILSWAGEKMPWLIVHFLLPMILLAGAAFGSLIDWIEKTTLDWRRGLVRQFAYTGLPVGLLFVMSFLLMASASAGQYLEVDGRVERHLESAGTLDWWGIYLPVIVAIAMIGIAITRWNSRQVLAAAGSVTLALMLVLQVNAGWNLSYRNGDVPRDMLVYVQTSPHLHQTVEELVILSHDLTGSMNMQVTYTGSAQWPLNWYLRNFTRRTLVHEIPEDPVSPVIIATPGEITAEVEARLENYTWVQHPLRWWIPEDETYRRFAIAPELNTEWRQNLQTDDPPPYSASDVLRSVGRSLMSVREPRQQARLFRMIVYRELDAPIGTYSYRIYVQNDVAPVFNVIRYRDIVAY